MIFLWLISCLKHWRIALKCCQWWMVLNHWWVAISTFHNLPGVTDLFADHWLDLSILRAHPLLTFLRPEKVHVEISSCLTEEVNGKLKQIQRWISYLLVPSVSCWKTRNFVYEAVWELNSRWQWHSLWNECIGLRIFHNNTQPFSSHFDTSIHQKPAVKSVCIAA